VKDVSLYVVQSYSAYVIFYALAVDGKPNVELETVGGSLKSKLSELLFFSTLSTSAVNKAKRYHFYHKEVIAARPVSFQSA